MKFLFVLIPLVPLFHVWLFLWYSPKHCLSGRKVGWPERYQAFFHWLARKIH